MVGVRMSGRLVVHGFVATVVVAGVLVAGVLVLVLHPMVLM
jgi:hypothetical protein